VGSHDLADAGVGSAVGRRGHRADEQASSAFAVHHVATGTGMTRTETVTDWALSVMSSITSGLGARLHGA
jgi:hypothetical protein